MSASIDGGEPHGAQQQQRLDEIRRDDQARRERDFAIRDRDDLEHRGGDRQKDEERQAVGVAGELVTAEDRLEQARIHQEREPGQAPDDQVEQHDVEDDPARLVARGAAGSRTRSSRSRAEGW